MRPNPLIANISIKRIRMVGDFVLLACGFLLIHVCNELIWFFDVVVVLFFTSMLVLVKLVLVLIALKRFQWAKNFILRGVLVVLLFVVGVSYDLIVIPHLLAYTFGLETEGTIASSRMNNQDAYFLTYEFKIINDESRFSVEQEVRKETYINKTFSSSVEVRYLGSNPKISFLVDIGQLKYETLIAYLLGGSMVLILNMRNIKERFVNWYNKSCIN